MSDSSSSRRGMQEIQMDARARKTRTALLRAFANLLLSGRYENLKIADITLQAGISRSTFYAHYASMDALLADSLAVPFAVLAKTIGPDFTEPELIRLLQHFWSNRTSARCLLVGTARRKTTEVLVRLIGARLKSAGLHRRGALCLPPRLAAIQLSEL